MLSVFCDAKDVIVVDLLQKGIVTITGAYYANLVPKLRDLIKEKRPRKLRKESRATSLSLRSLAGLISVGPHSRKRNKALIILSADSSIPNPRLPETRNNRQPDKQANERYLLNYFRCNERRRSAGESESKVKWNGMVASSYGVVNIRLPREPDKQIGFRSKRAYRRIGGEPNGCL
ncbi:hypothetical protein Trydic_g21334 [Trypoxylus dichotomus]